MDRTEKATVARILAPQALCDLAVPNVLRGKTSHPRSVAIQRARLMRLKERALHHSYCSAH